VHGSTISTTVTSTVILGTGHYENPLTVTGSGVVLPFLYGTNGVYGAQSTDKVSNAGMIAGAYGGYRTAGNGIAGGVGVALTHGGTILDIGTIAGGLGGASNLYGCGAGGDGVDIAGGKISNSGVMRGGAGGSSDAAQYGGGGGAGVLATGAKMVVSNTGSIAGGAGGACGRTGPGGAGGAGVRIGDGHLVNAGGVTGGEGGYAMAGASGLGGDGVDVTASGTVTNTGTVTAGGGGTARYGQAGGGGAGVDLSAAGTLINHAFVTGGAGAVYPGEDFAGSAGGAGVLAGRHAMIVNTGTIVGGLGGTSRSLNQYPAGAGGFGIDLAGAGTITNAGSLLGGAGGIGDAYRCAGGAGGDGAAVSDGGVLINTGFVAGGPGGAGDHAAYGARGSGVYLNGGTVIDYGTIAGGQNGGMAGDALAFGPDPATLIVYHTAVFQGDVAANSAAQDVLELDGREAGTLSGLGEAIVGFNSIVAVADADWTLSGTIAGSGQVQIGGGATLTLDGTVSIESIVFNNVGRAALQLGDPLAVTSAFSGFAAHDSVLLDGVLATSLSFAHGVLTLYAADGLVADTLKFRGLYEAANFVLKIEGPNTEILYSSKAALPQLWPMVGVEREGSGRW
jgi:hypothetical protein